MPVLAKERSTLHLGFANLTGEMDVQECRGASLRSDYGSKPRNAYHLSHSRPDVAASDMGRTSRARVPDRRGPGDAHFTVGV
jgi:hypothetical protein